MTDKERLEIIKMDNERHHQEVVFSSQVLSDIKWLIKQAEKREYWMKQHRKRANELEDAYFKIQLIENQLHQAQAKAERYEKALEFYADKENYKPFDGIFLSRYQNKIDEDGGKTARQALESDEN